MVVVSIATVIIANPAVDFVVGGSLEGVVGYWIERALISKKEMNLNEQHRIAIRINEDPM